MNIAILHYSVPPIVGGVETVIAHHARLMSADGYSVRLIAARGEALGEHIPLVVMPLADSRHERVIQMKDGLDRGEVTEEFDVIRDKLAIELQAALTGVDVLIAHNLCSPNEYKSQNIQGSPCGLPWHSDSYPFRPYFCSFIAPPLF